MKTILQKTVALFLSAVLMILVLPLSSFVKASDNPNEEAALETAAPAPDVPAKSAILIDGITGKILYEKNADEKMPPASITKIMTMLLVMEAIEKGTLKFDDMVTGSELASSMGGTQIWLEPGEQFSVHDLLKACAVASANDASMALAEHVGGSETGFVDMMNSRAADLGMTNTTFFNPTGLDAVGHLSTARDIALMSKELLRHPAILDYTKIWMDSLRDGKNELVNTNKLVRFYQGCTGLKTGTTSGAGSCLSASATRGDVSLIAVVMGCTTSVDRFSSARQLLDFGFNNFAMYRVEIPKEILAPIPVANGMQSTVELDAGAENSIMVPKGRGKDIKQEVKLMKIVPAPVQAGQELGKVILKLDDTILLEYSIKAKAAVEQMTLWNAIKLLLKSVVK